MNSSAVPRIGRGMAQGSNHSIDIEMCFVIVVLAVLRSCFAQNPGFFFPPTGRLGLRTALLVDLSVHQLLTPRKHILKSIGWIPMKFVHHIHAPQSEPCQFCYLHSL